MSLTRKGKARPAHIVVEGGMEGVHHHEYGRRNVQHMANNVADAVATTTLSKCAEVGP